MIVRVVLFREDFGTEKRISITSKADITTIHTVVRQSETPVVRDLGREALVPFITDFSDKVIVEGEFVVGRNDQVGVDVPDLDGASKPVRYNRYDSGIV